jgi:hypothetical protein
MSFEYWCQSSITIIMQLCFFEGSRVVYYQYVMTSFVEFLLICLPLLLEHHLPILLASHLFDLFILLHCIKECFDFIIFALIFRHSARTLIPHLFFLLGEQSIMSRMMTPDVYNFSFFDSILLSLVYLSS